MFGLLAWLPIIGPLLDGVTSMFSKFKDTELGKYQANADVRKTEVQASAQVLIAFKDDIGIRMLRDIAITPWVIWGALIGWDTIVALRYPGLKFNVSDVPEGVTYLPGLALTFLLGNIGLNKWKR